MTRSPGGALAWGGRTGRGGGLPTTLLRREGSVRLEPRSFWGVSLVAVAAATPFSGCDYPGVPATVAQPSAVGVIDRVEHEDDGTYVYTLAGGTTVVWPSNGAHLDGPAHPDEGDLLIYGESPLHGGETPWRATAQAVGGVVDDRGHTVRSPCYPLTADGEIRDGAMALSLGFRLPLAEDFPYAFPDERFLNLPGGNFCLDETGRVTSSDAAGQRP